MGGDDVNIAMQQAKLVFVRQTQFYMLLAALLSILGWLAIGWWWQIPEFAILYCLTEILLLAFLLMRVGGRFSILFGLLAFVFMLMVFPFSSMPLIPLKQFQKDREYIDYQRRAALLPSLAQSSVHNLTLHGRFPLVAWVGMLLGPFFMVAGYVHFHNTVVIILGFVVFCIGIIALNRAIISIRGEKIVIRQSGLGGSLRRSNFTVIHRIEVISIEQLPGRLKIRYAFVGTGVEREVVFFGSKRACRRIVEALTLHTEQNLYDLGSLTAVEEQEPDDFSLTDSAGITPPGEAPAPPRLPAAIGVRTLISAIRSNQIGLVNQLLEVGVDVNARDANGQTPLQVALNGGNEQVIYALRQAGATG